MIQLTDVSKQFDGKTALDRVTLNVPKEQILALIGPSGCGKSTLLRLIVGLLYPDMGTIEVNGTQATGATIQSLRLKMGYVIQEGGLFPHLTAADNVALVARSTLRWTEQAIRLRLEELSNLVQLPPELLRRYPSQLSGGQRQRVGLMRALMLDPALLLMDEPLGALDPMIRSQLQEDLKAIFQRLKRTVLLVTHDMGEAAYFGDEIALMRDGRIVQKGTLDSLLHHPVHPFVTEFIRAQRPLWDGSELSGEAKEPVREGQPS
jgi:osmoprotectant transport system ATP-binding protein